MCSAGTPSRRRGVKMSMRSRLSRRIGPAKARQRIGPWGLDRRADGPDPLRSEDLVENGRALCVTIPHPESDWARSLRVRHRQVAGLLHHPPADWVDGDPWQVDPPGVKLDEEE